MSNDSVDLERLLKHWRVRVETHNGVTRVHVPGAPTIRDLPKVFLWGIFPASIALMIFVIMCFDWAGMSALDMNGDLIEFVFYGAITAVIVLRAFYHLRRHIILQIDANDLSLFRVHGTRPVIQARWPRSAISDVHLNRSNDRLRFRIKGAEPSEIRLTFSHPVNAWICGQVAEALEQQVAVTAREAGVSYASVFTPEVQTAKGHVWAHRILLGASAVLMMAGVCMMFTRAAPISLYLLMFAAMPAGIALGTQKKEYYF